MSHLLPSYLHTLRKQWGLSQPDLAALLGVTGSALSRFENGSRHPSAELVVGAEVMFGHSAKDVFPKFYHDIECTIVDRARALYKSIESKTDTTSRAKLHLLSEIIERASQTTLDV
jgi:transcriptional regulator with XRE-family HTH domain